MNKLSNQVQLRGRLGRDVLLQESSNGNAYLTNALATNEKYTKSDGETVEETHWHEITAFGPCAENMAKLLQKGNEVMVLGKLKYNKYVDEQGINRTIAKIYVDEFFASKN
jgi:single-strand DNA-binding protein